MSADPNAPGADSYPRESARTQRYTLGEPRDVTVSPDGQRIIFLRSRGGTDPVNCLWAVDATTGEERLVGDPETLLGDRDDDELPPEERARRERAREGAGGITTYATDAAATVTAFAIGGRLFVGGLLSGQARELSVAGPVFDPRPDPLARRVAYVSGRLLCIGELDGRWRVLAGGEDDERDTITWGSADFIAAEEMGRFRGYWWSPDGEHLAVTRVDTAAVQRWYLGDPADPAAAPRELAYPAAGTPNADVTLHVIALDGSIVDVEWDRDRFPYLADVRWSEAGLITTVQSRDQRDLAVLGVEPSTGATDVRFADHDDAWVELVAGVPRLLPDGTLVTCADRDGARRLLVAGEAVTPPDLQVRGVAAADGDGVTFTANALDDATSVQVWHRATDGTLRALTDEPGIHGVATGGGTVVVRTTTLAEPGAQWETLDGVELAGHAATPLLRADVHLSVAGESRIATAVLLPHDHDGSPLPVLLDPYGGPHGPRVVSAHNAHLASQWFADQGFAVVVADGRGTPGRGSVWERAVHHDLVGPVLDDQITALHHAAEEHPLDLSRVAIRGWSFGGFLAALAVLRRPDVFHAAIAGAPVTEWRLYDTHYTERYLGDPNVVGDVYDANSLLSLADVLTRPLLLIHGLADDNVVAAHTLRLSSALLAAGKPHEVLPLVGITHMTPQEVVAEHLLVHQLDFLRRSLPGERTIDPAPDAPDYGAG
jgi:dipeptidyl-peptidase 4